MRPRLFLRYHNARETVKKLCAPEIGEKIKPIWDFDGEYELNSVWRDCGVDRMWILFGMVELPYYPRHPLNFDIMKPRGNRKRGYIEVPFKARGASSQSYERRYLQWEKILAMIYNRVGLITCGVWERNIYSRLRRGDIIGAN